MNCRTFLMTLSAAAILTVGASAQTKRGHRHHNNQQQSCSTGTQVLGGLFYQSGMLNGIFQR